MLSGSRVRALLLTILAYHGWLMNIDEGDEPPVERPLQFKHRCGQCEGSFWTSDTEQWLCFRCHISLDSYNADYAKPLMPKPKVIMPELPVLEIKFPVDQATIPGPVSSLREIMASLKDMLANAEKMLAIYQSVCRHDTNVDVCSKCGSTFSI